MSTADDDRQWAEALAGRDDPAATAGTLREAKLLRAALRQRAPPDELALQREAAEGREKRAAQLLARAQQDPVLGPALAREAARAPRRALWSAIAAASLAGVAVALLWWQAGPDTTVLRNAPDEVYRLHAQDPAALRDSIAVALQAAGVSATRYQRFGREGLDADLPRPLTPEVAAVLARFGIPAPADSVLRIEIEAP